MLTEDQSGANGITDFVSLLPSKNVYNKSLLLLPFLLKIFTEKLGI